MLHIKRGIHAVHILLIQLFPQQLHGLTKPLEVDDFPLPQEPDHIVHIGIIGKSENVVVSCTGFLL